MTSQLRPVLLALLLICSTLGALTSTELSDEAADLTSARSLACTGDVCLNEALPNPNGYDSGTWPNGEWVELYNNGNTTIDVSNWYVTNKASKMMYFNETTIVDYDANDSTTWEIAPGDYMVIARNGMSNGMFYLANTNDVIDLYTAAGTLLDQATWNYSSGAPSGVSLEEDTTGPTNDWVATNTPTPGGINTGSGTGGPTIIPSDLHINEVMADPWPSFDGDMWPGGEWIELTNTGSNDMNLTGWSIVDQAGKTLLFNESHLIDAESAGYLIAPGATRMVAVNGSGSSMLNNGVEMIQMKWPNGSVAQQVSWTDNEQGFSLVNDAASTYMVYAAYPTPNAPNPLSLDVIAMTPSPVKMTELLANSSADGTPYPDGEWLELFNDGPVDVDLAGWSIIDGMGNITLLDPASLVYNDTQASTMIEADGRRLVQFTTDTQLWNFYNHLMLADTTGSIVDAAWYAADYGVNVSLIPAESSTDPWVPAPWMTPGQPEPGLMDSTGEVSFSEIMPDGVGSDSQQWPLGEWLEIQNNGEQAIDVAGWKLQAASRTLTLHQFNMPLQSTSVIQPGNVALIALNGTSSFYLKHTTPDSIGLVDANGAVVDTIAWSSTVEGESLIAPNSSHAGAGPSGTAAGTGSDWLLSAWTSPGRVNPVWPAYTGSENVSVTEVLAYCSDDSIDPVEDWIEFMNTGTEDLNLSRWHIDTVDQDRRFIRSDAMWDSVDMGWNATIVEPGQRAVFLMDDSLLSGLGDGFTLSNPDGVPITTVQWSIVSDCQTMMPGNTSEASWIHTMWPTPGTEEPNATQFAQLDDVKFTRFMSEGSTGISSNTEFFEISNIGDKTAYLEGWTFSVTTSGGTDPFVFGDLTIPAMSAVIFAADPNGLGVYEDGIIVGFASGFNEAPTLPNDGAALQITDPAGALADTIVYGNGPVEVNGWSGISLVEPVSGINLIIYHRGDGCGALDDTDTVSDWHHRWGRLGGSTFCDDQTFSGESEVIPLIGPTHGLLDVLDWIEGANTSLNVHVYQLSEPRLVQALIDAQGRGVDVTVVLDAGSPGFWADFDMINQYGMASELVKAGVTTYWFGDGGVEPYAYIHSKVAVRDGTSVWISSGNWKGSSMPAPGVRGNVDWGVLIENDELASIVLQQMSFDEEPLRQHISPASASDEPNGWNMPTATPVDGARSQSITATVNGALLTCPDNCIEGLVELIDSAEDELLLSLQYLDMDWSWGWGDNPIFTALRQSAENGVAVRLIINGAYLDQDVQDVVDTFNEVWNSSDGLDVAAIVMSEDDDVSKLHNKGLIIDQETVLVSSINWGNSAVNRNREMGLVLTSTEVAAPYLTAWYEDWNRLDNVTDTDQDGLPDIWEVPNGLNRTTHTLPGPNMAEGLYDADMDGITNQDEYKFGSHPTNADTDGDCIPDGLEVAWAQSTALDPTIEAVSPRNALNLADADMDGVNESDVLGCDLSGIDIDNTPTEPVDNGTLDDDNDGVINADDECPDTLADLAVNLQGCSTEQRLVLATPSSGDETNLGSKLMLMLMVAGVILAVCAFLVLRNIEQEAEDAKDLITLESAQLDALAADPISIDGFQAPVLDGTGAEKEPPKKVISETDLARVPGWDEAMVQSYFDQGWTMDQLVVYYEEQVQAHRDSSQD